MHRSPKPRSILGRAIQILHPFYPIFGVITANLGETKRDQKGIITGMSLCKKNPACTKLKKEFPHLGCKLKIAKGIECDNRISRDRLTVQLLYDSPGVHTCRLLVALFFSYLLDLACAESLFFCVFQEGLQHAHAGVEHATAEATRFAIDSFMPSFCTYTVPEIFIFSSFLPRSVDSGSSHAPL